jgi:hypothetical protein
LNTYQTKFVLKCIVNQKPVEHSLTISTQEVIVVEDLLSFIKNLEPAFHEIIADKLAEQFGGKQVLVANHHGVIISTERATW